MRTAVGGATCGMTYVSVSMCQKVAPPSALNLAESTTFVLLSELPLQTCQGKYVFVPAYLFLTKA